MMLSQPPYPSNGAAHSTVSLFADYFEVKCRQPLGQNNGGAGGLRGTVKNFTRRARNRMLRKMACMRDIDKGIFATLTWPDFPGLQPDKWRMQRNAFFQRMRRMFPELKVIWRVEYKPRQSGDFQDWIAPHIHLLIFGGETYLYDDIDGFRAWLAVNWNAVIDEKDLDHLRAGTQADLITSRRHAMAYASKYSAKIDGSFSMAICAGRHWGYWGEWDTSALLVIALNFLQYRQLRRYIVKWLSAGQGRSNNRHAWRINKSPPFKGFGVLSLGDSSTTKSGVTTRTAFQMLASLADC